MNCDDFVQRLHERIDERLSLEEDIPLQHHAAHCDVCGGQLFAWQQISRVLPTCEPVPKKSAARFVTRLAVSVAMIAASVFFAFVVMTSDPNSESSSPSLAMLSGSKPLLASSPMTIAAPDATAFVSKETTEQLTEQLTESPPSRIAASEWVDVVRKRDWVRQSMPTVQSFGRGVAPLGRSLLRAVTILTTSGNGQPS
ncbi:hypothetical protein CA13_54140 [Planctomycetes bacterium CA13]|uniref:Zinc-finger domain-containing protein n=1 Tax=Novipirellula herctigrandis TaxID=2527986 RepID=A0A5C5Z9R2_9BACT|nr:hypothetical protein CA13_54140 [Planctomycetes bacterium CA13]